MKTHFQSFQHRVISAVSRFCLNFKIIYEKKSQRKSSAFKTVHLLECISSVGDSRVEKCAELQTFQNCTAASRLYLRAYGKLHLTLPIHTTFPLLPGNNFLARFSEFEISPSFGHCTEIFSLYSSIPRLNSPFPPIKRLKVKG